MSEEPRRLAVTAVEQLDQDELTHLTASLERHWTLKAALDWCLGQRPPVLDADVVFQDEFTHDVIVRLPSGRCVVYDAT
jgi:hypothetical protein